MKKSNLIGRFQCDFTRFSDISGFVGKSKFSLPTCTYFHGYVQVGPECRLLDWLITLDHADVVGAVSDGQGDALAMSFDEVDNEWLLERSDAATEHSLTASRRVQQQQLHVTAQRVHLQSPWQPIKPVGPVQFSSRIYRARKVNGKGIT